MVAVVPASKDALTVLSQWRLEPLTVALILASGSLYVLGIVRVRRSGSAWPASRTAAFGGGLATLAAALLSPVDAYADVSFTVHMAQHLLLSLLAPPLLALGAPITLALRARSPALRRWITESLRSPVAAVLANPIVGWTLFVGIPVVVHASRLFDAALRSTPWHALEHGLWLGAALIFWWPIIGVDPNPHAVSWPARMLSLFLAMPAMSFLALGIYSADAPLYPTYASSPPPWGDALGDQQAATVMMWLVGNLALVLAIVLVAAAWKRDEDARQRRLEERQDRADALAGSG